MTDLGLFFNIFEAIRKWIFPPKTKLFSFQIFLDAKSKEARNLSRKRRLSADHIMSWYQQLSRGLTIALGSDVKNADIKLNCGIIESKIDGLKFYGGSQSQSNLKRTLSECNGCIEMMRKDISPDMLSPQFEPADLKTCK